jgi:hypothetical protein
MADSFNNKTLKELLDRLSIESWQLELVVSGFAIFLAGSSLEPIKDYGSRLFVINEGLNNNFGLLPMTAVILLGSVFFVFVNLILHIVFRGMWISAIGLRSISGEIDLEQLNFVKPFDRFMKSKLSSFDSFIKRLDDISSVIFAFTFLLVFMLISFGLFFLFTGIVIYLLNQTRSHFDLADSNIFIVINVSIVLIIILSGLLYFIDFITLGFLKRKRWISVWYFPFYRVLSLITFSWLYRPLYYNLIDNKFGRRIGLFLFPYFITIGLIVSTKSRINLYIPEKKEDTEISDRYYADKRDTDLRIKYVSIPSQYIRNGYLELFILYYATNDDETIAQLCPGVTPDVASGIGSDLNITFNTSKEDSYHSPPDSMIECVVKNYEIRIDDSLYQELDFYFYTDSAFDQEGIKSIIDLSHLKRGEHQLDIDRYQMLEKDSIGLQPYVNIPFWIE